jgi:hypothetical protein
MVACGSTADPSSLGGASSRGLPLPTSTFHLKKTGKTIMDSGKKIAVEPTAVIGYIDGAISEERGGKQMVSLSGWAASADFSRPANAVVGFVGRKAVAALKPTGERPDVASGYDKPGLKGVGFELSVPTRSLGCSVRAEGLGIFGIAGNEATALQWLGDVDQRISEACKQSLVQRP